ncbi:MAG: PEP-CTERM sorting domain-containing protein [Deltaproteobacteria bacterium]|nr:PEP-CTERM sorting domain-containing protein [Deltaproteobacteria bacterium]
MKSKFSGILVLLLAVATFSVMGARSAAADTIVIQTGSEVFTSAGGDATGDFLSISGNVTESSPGQVEEVLGTQTTASLQDNGSESNSYMLEMGTLRLLLDTAGITTTNTLVFGFGLNETGAVGTNSVTITSLTMSFERAGGGTDVFSLNGDQVQVYNYIQGQVTAEAKFEVGLGFDFMSEYSNSSTEKFMISADIDNTSDGFEIFFLSSGFTSPPGAIPEPASLFLLGTGLAGMASRIRRRSAA